ncbi:pyruvate kinase [Acinetobacter baumannii]|uniref:pyruvate kinase n=1 Tax=Acinetobacter baumannii TaxID=470 RepID=UPI0023419EF0|nr:pyruvate kinase [Acinetobacter baumannii]
MFKIIATIGQPTCEYENIIEIIKSGAHILRYNLAANLGFEEHARRIKIARKAIFDLNKKDIKILYDIPFPGKKIRLGMLPEPKHFIEKGTVLTFGMGKETDDINKFIPIDYDNIMEVIGSFDNRKVFTIGDGELAFQILEINKESFSAQAISSDYLPCVKSINIGHIITSHIEDEEFQKLINFVADFPPDIVAFSFTENKVDLVNYIKIFSGISINHKLEYFAKIESKKGVDNISEISAVIDGIIVARGDLALCEDYKLLGVLQRKILKLAKQNNVPCYLSTQLFESALNKYVPTRAEISDVSNAVFNGFHGVMLAKETTSSIKAFEIVRSISEIIEVCERELENA